MKAKLFKVFTSCNVFTNLMGRLVGWKVKQSPDRRTRNGLSITYDQRRTAFTTSPYHRPERYFLFNEPGFTTSWLLLSVLLASCTVSTKEIAYGEDGCKFCQMGIVDQRYGAELVTTKGKVYTFDAIECMIHYMEAHKEQDFAHIVINTHDHPGELTSAREAHFLVSKNLPSPMGMYLTGFRNEENAKEAQVQHLGELYRWDALVGNFSEIKNALNANYHPSK